MNRMSIYVTSMVGRVAEARRVRRLERATRDLSDFGLRDIGLRRDWLGQIERRPPDF